MNLFADDSSFTFFSWLRPGQSAIRETPKHISGIQHECGIKDRAELSASKIQYCLLATIQKRSP